jgi:fumarate reductase subunit C
MIQFSLALSIPLWMVTLQPLIFGILHLFSSTRLVPKTVFQHYASNHQRPFLFLGIALICLGVLACLFFHSGLFRPDLHRRIPEYLQSLLAVLLLSFTGILVFMQLHRLQAPFLLPKGAFFVLLLGLLSVFTWLHPLESAAMLLILHHFVGFAYWQALAKSRWESRSASLILGLFGFIHLCFLLPCLGFGPISWITFISFKLQPMFAFLPPIPAFAQSLDLVALSSVLFPHTADGFCLEQGVRMFAFGQAFHYYLWLHVLPQQEIRQEMSPSFKQSYRSFLQDFHPYGQALFLVGFVLILFIALLTLFKNPLLALMGYTTVSFAHGWIELAGLAFLFPQAPPRLTPTDKAIF